MKTGTIETSPATKAIAHETAARAHEQPPNVKQLQAYQQMANNSRRVQAQAQLQAVANRNAVTTPKGPGIVQRTAIRISFAPGAAPEMVPGTMREDNILFFDALQDKEKYTPEKVQEIIRQMSQPGASDWDKSIVDILTKPAAKEEEDDDDDDGREKEPVSEEEEAAAISDGESNPASSSKKRGTKRARSKSKSRGAKKKTRAKKKAAKAAAEISDEDEDAAAAPVKANKKAAAKISDEEEDDDDAIPAVEIKEEKKGKAAAGPGIEWNPKITNGKLSYENEEWRVIAGSNYQYPIMNVDAIAGKWQDGQRVTYKRPVQDYGPLAKDLGIKDQINEFGVSLITIAGAKVNQTIPDKQTEGIIALQEGGREAGEQHAAKKASGLKIYRPKLMKEKYAIEWGQPALSIKGTADDRTMVRNMNINYQPAGDGAEPLLLPGERVHRDELFEQETLHGNGINARFSLVYLEDGELNLAPGQTLPFGSGRTTSSAAEKHNNANRIATMLVASGQIGSVAEYNDGKHSHSEQAMIVYLSKHLDVFDDQLASLAEKDVSIVALVLDMYSNPNTVCEQCHNSLATFFTTTNWKGKITKRLKAGAGENVNVGAPDVIIRVSSNKSFSASAAAAIPKAKAAHAVQQGAHGVNFIERTPFNKPHY